MSWRRFGGRQGKVGAALVAVVVLTLGSTSCHQKAVVEESAPPPLSVTTMKFADFPNGPAPTTFAGGPTTISPEDVSDDPASKFHVVDGKLTVEPTLREPNSSYFTSPDLGSPVVKIGARWVWIRREGSPNGAMGLVVSNRIVRPPFPVHVVVTQTGWNYGVWDPMEGESAPELDILQAGKFDPPLKDDGKTVYEVEVTVDGDKAFLRLPDGQRRTIRDKRIAEYAGKYATFEVWARDGVTDATAAFTEVWAAHQPAQ